MTSSPVTSWQIDGKTTESVAGFLFLASSITADGDCSHEMKSFLLLGRKAMTNLDSTLRTRDIKKKKKNQRHHFTDKGTSCQSYGFSSNHIWV